MANSNEIKRLSGMLTLGAIASKSTTIKTKKVGHMLLTDAQKEAIEAAAEKKRKDDLARKGIKEFFYGEHVILARNKKNADRKAKNKGYL